MSKPLVSFAFQVIPLADAQRMVIAGDGNYADLKAKLLEALPALNDNEAFAFGLPSGNDEVPEDKRRGITLALNATLKKAGLPWRVTYSGMKKLFVAIPKGPLKKLADLPKPPPPAEPYTGQQVKQAQKIRDIAVKNFNVNLKGQTRDVSNVRKAIVAVAQDSGIGTRAIAKALNIRQSGVMYLLKTKGKAIEEIDRLKTAMNGGL